MASTPGAGVVTTDEKPGSCRVASMPLDHMPSGEYGGGLPLK